jgi:hypothetical protein
VFGRSIAFNLFPTLGSYPPSPPSQIYKRWPSHQGSASLHTAASRRPQVVSEGVLVLYQFLGNMVRTEERDMELDVERRMVKDSGCARLSTLDAER